MAPSSPPAVAAAAARRAAAGADDSNPAAPSTAGTTAVTARSITDPAALLRLYDVLPLVGVVTDEFDCTAGVPLSAQRTGFYLPLPLPAPGAPNPLINVDATRRPATPPGLSGTQRLRASNLTSGA